MVALRRREISPVRLGLTFRQELRASLARLAHLTCDGGRFAGLPAFWAVTNFHQGLLGLGFEIERDGPIAPRITGASQCRITPGGSARPLGCHVGAAPASERRRRESRRAVR